MVSNKVTSAAPEDDHLPREQTLVQHTLHQAAQAVKAAAHKLLRIVDLLAANPFITATGIAGELGVAFTTAQRAIERLERMGIVKQVTEAKRDRVYCAQALLDILEEPANLIGALSE
jgi:ribosomal protein S25